MDTLTHALLGYGFAHLRRPDGGDGQTDKAVVIGAVIASELPDIDVLLMPGGPLNHIRYHRGPTHSFLGVLLLSGLLTFVLGRFYPRARKQAVFGWSLAAMVVTHLFADWITGFGTQLAFPFSGHRFALDWVALYEPMMVLPFLAGLLLIYRFPTWKRPAMIGALVLSTAWVLGRGATHDQVARQVWKQYAAQSPVESVTVHPTLYSLSRWEYVVKTPGQYYLGQRDLASGRSTEYAAYSRPDLEGDPVLSRATQDPAVQTVLSFARNPLVTYREEGDHHKVIVSDFRGGYAFNFHLILDQEGRSLKVKRDYGIRYQTANEPEPAAAGLTAGD